MLKQYFYRDNDTASLTANKSQNNTAQNKDNVSIEQAASVACVLEDEDTEEEVAIKDAVQFQSERNSERCSYQSRIERCTAK